MSNYLSLHQWQSGSIGPNRAKNGPYLGQIGWKQPILKVDTQEFPSYYGTDKTHHCQCIYQIIWACTSNKISQMDQIGSNLGQIWAKFGPNQAKTANFESRYPRLWVIVRLCKQSSMSVHISNYLSLYQWQNKSNGPNCVKFGPTLGQIGPKQPILQQIG